tara:strand:- start:14482 stop:15918 length:1437 start_codon:yes stop_codon:yes gene_type:complete
MFISFIIITFIAAVLAYTVRINKYNHLISIVYSLLVAAFSVYEYQHLGETQLVFFTPDALGIIFLFILGLLGFFTASQYRFYAYKRKEYPSNVANHNAAYVLFLGALVGLNLTNHFGLLWAFVEATTLTGSILIYHDRNKFALEAVWKYIFVASISIALAFAGILFLSIGLQELGEVELSFEEIQKVASLLDPIWLKASFLFILTGFSVKMGIFPMFSVDIDAKDTSPSPVGAMFSSVLMNAGFLAIFRFYVAFSHAEIQPWMNHILMIVGFASIFFAASYLIRVKNYKRIFAYSSMEHAGLITLAISMGSKAGYIAAILHIIFHSFVKAGIFYQLGQVAYTFKTKLLDQAGGYLYLNPAGGLVLILGLLSIVGFPPSGLFVSEFLIFKSFIVGGHIWLVITVMLMLALIMYTLADNVLRLIFITPKNMTQVDINATKLVSKWESLSQLFLIGLTMYLGFAQPDFLMDLINEAVALLS